MGWIGCVHCEKLWCDFVARTSSLIAQVQPILYRVPFVTKHCQMHRNTTKCSRTWVWFQWGGSSAFFAKKFRCEFVAQTFALIAPVQPISHRFSCKNEIIQYAPKHYKTHQFMSLAFNGVDLVRSLREIPMQFHGTNLCINCTSSTRFAPSFVL